MHAINCCIIVKTQGQIRAKVSLLKGDGLAASQGPTDTLNQHKEHS